ncbi:bacterio-opsin activator domain-containing protein [Haloarchaeobius litoreus]|uniref:Bacterio-opsin activator domain-containing protein n=1 Tax=Haloarchaeobius litoreus TaxID=755306 RepID=A0ABD6DQB4_9EURY|nr:bacterio-opsin activator domain-containing protein [Haloarchaeobius litoreus]
MTEEFRVLYLTSDPTPEPELPDGPGSGLSVETVGAVDELAGRLRTDGADCVVVCEDRDHDGLAEVHDAYADTVPFVHVTTNPALDADEVVGDGVLHTLSDGQPVPFCELAAYVSTSAEFTDPANRFAVFAHHAQDGVVTADSDGHVTETNPAMADIFGFEDGELVGEHLSTLLPEDGGNRSLLPPFAPDGEDTALQWQPIRFTATDADGSDVPVLVTFGRFETASGAHYTGVVRDVSQRERLESELESHLERVTDAFFALDTEFRFRYVNERAAELIDVDPDTVAGDLVWDRFPAAVDSRFQAQYEQAMETQESVSFEEYFPPLSTWFSVRAYPSETGLSVYFRDVTERKEREQALERQRDELEGLAQLNRVLQHVNETLVTAANRTVVERSVCEQLVESSLFAAAWLGRVDSRRDTVEPATSAGQDGVEPESTVPVSEAVTHPAGRAVASQSVELVDDLAALDSADPWVEAARERGFSSVAAVPVSYKGSQYGVVAVFATKPDAFSEGVVETLSQLQSVVGLAINATERRAALIADGTIQVGLALRDASNPLFRAVEEHDLVVELDGATAIDDHTFVEYFTVTGDPDETFFDIIRAFDRVEGLTVLDQGPEETLVTMTIVDPPISTLLAEHGGTVREIVVEDGSAELVAELPKSGSIRSVVDSLEGMFETVDLRTKRERKRPERRVSEFRSTLDDQLTDRQREVLEAALRDGYFEWPRESDAEEIAATLGISSPTFHEHLRAAQQKLLTDLFDVPPADRERDVRAGERP